jgi:hypothetical protein
MSIDGRSQEILWFQLRQNDIVFAIYLMHIIAWVSGKSIASQVVAQPERHRETYQPGTPYIMF